MGEKLAGVMMMYNGVSQDYCFEEAIESMLGVCDHVFVCDPGSTDGTTQRLLELSGDCITVILTDDEWHSQRGKEKLSYFTNKAINAAEKNGYEYVLSIQSDEVLSERSNHAIRKAMDMGHEAYLIRRINLWGSPYTQLIVPENRQPCSTAVIRLAKSCYRAFDDAESLNAQASTMILNEATIFHMGFVRKREVMVEKIRHMQADVFGITPDEKLKGMEVFDPWKWFDKSDVEIISERLPVYIEKWAKERVY